MCECELSRTRWRHPRTLELSRSHRRSMSPRESHEQSCDTAPTRESYVRVYIRMFQDARTDKRMYSAFSDTTVGVARLPACLPACLPAYLLVRSTVCVLARQPSAATKRREADFVTGRCCHQCPRRRACCSPRVDDTETHMKKERPRERHWDSERETERLIESLTKCANTTVVNESSSGTVIVFVK